MPPTSLVPTVVALSSFFSQNFPNISWYPYWYLGNPYQFLIGPVVPVALAILNIKNQIANIYLGLIGVSFLIGSFGLYLFLREWGVRGRQSIISAILYLVLPAGFFLLNFQNGLNHIAFAALPFTYILYKKLLQKDNTAHALILSITISFVLLINISILLPALIGFIALFFSIDSKNHPKGGFIAAPLGWEEKLFKTLVILLLGIAFATFWYTPGFWWVLLRNPSFGGMPLIKLVQFLFQLLLQILPIILAVSFVRWRHLKPSKPLLFGILFFASFFFLTVVRFISDPDFVMDWIGFALELQFGGAIILGSIMQKFKVQSAKFLILGIITVFLIAIGWLLVIRDWNATLNKSDYQERIVELLKDVPKDERVFLSGSQVFWINSILPIQQVRGGRDETSIHPFWADAAYQIREGESPDLTQNWLTTMGTSYILVHGPDSEEPFHDFKHPEKFSKFELISENEDDFLYKVPKAYLARIADKDILKVRAPKNGVDQVALSAYTKTIKHPISFLFEKPNKIVINGNIHEEEIISLAVSYDPGWKIQEGQGTILKDSLGNIIIEPKKQGDQRFVLVFSQSPMQFLIPMIFSGLLILILLRFKQIYPYFSRLLSKFPVGLSDSEENY